MNLPVGPKAPLPIEFFKLGMWPVDTLEARQKKFGDTFRVGPENPPLIYFSSPNALKTIFTAGPEQLLSAGVKVLKPLIGLNSLILLEGRDHERQRRLLMPPFHGQQINIYGQQILDVTENLMRQTKLGEVKVLRQVMQEITLRVILKALFGSSQEQQYEQLLRLTRSLLDSVGNTLGFFSVILSIPSKRLGRLESLGTFFAISTRSG